MEDCSIEYMERKIRSLGNYSRWWGTIIFIVGVFITIIEASGGIVIAALGIIVAVQGSFVQYISQLAYITEIFMRLERIRNSYRIVLSDVVNFTAKQSSEYAPLLFQPRAIFERCSSHRF